MAHDSHLRPSVVGLCGVGVNGDGGVGVRERVGGARGANGAQRAVQPQRQLERAQPRRLALA
eukprot:3883372-Pleurochrysis_carterae.AAC.2